MKRFLVVFSLRAKVVNFVVGVVLLVEKPLNILHVISVEPLDSLRWESHRDDVGQNIT